MKRTSFVIVFMILASAAMAQLKVKVTCPAFDVDILEGKVNGYKATVGAGELKNKFPCFTSTTTDSSKCGEAIFYKDKDISFYTTRDYIEIGEKFKGKISLPLIGASKGSLFKYLGNPQMKDAGWEAFQTAYGILVLYYNKANKVRLIRFSTKDASTLSICE